MTSLLSIFSVPTASSYVWLLILFGQDLSLMGLPAWPSPSSSPLCTGHLSKRASFRSISERVTGWLCPIPAGAPLSSSTEQEKKTTSTEETDTLASWGQAGLPAFFSTTFLETQKRPLGRACGMGVPSSPGHFIPPATHHVELSCCPALSLPPVEGAVVSCGPLPGAMEVVGHKADEIQVPSGGTEKGVRG